MTINFYVTDNFLFFLTNFISFFIFIFLYICILFYLKPDTLFSFSAALPTSPPQADVSALPWFSLTNHPSFSIPSQHPCVIFNFPLVKGATFLLFFTHSQRTSHLSSSFTTIGASHPLNISSACFSVRTHFLQGALTSPPEQPRLPFSRHAAPKQALGLLWLPTHNTSLFSSINSSVHPLPFTVMPSIFPHRDMFQQHTHASSFPVHNHALLFL